MEIEVLKYSSVKNLSLKKRVQIYFETKRKLAFTYVCQPILCMTDVNVLVCMGTPGFAECKCTIFGAVEPASRGTSAVQEEPVVPWSYGGSS